LASHPWAFWPAALVPSPLLAAPLLPAWLLPTWLLPAIVAPFVGSFLGVLIRRLPAGRPVGLARSACEACGHGLGPLEMVPIASFLVLRGRCRACGARIAPAHLGVEVAALAVALAAGAVLAEPGPLWAGCVLGWTVLALAWIDMRHFLLPDVLTLPLVLAGLAATWALQPDALADHALAAALGYLALRGLGAAYRARATPSCWRRRGRGPGWRRCR
jgi:leader peptidase (prepilin peptidase)/N-methyltransferase